MNLLRQGILVVFDEMSKVKNQSAGVRKAAHAIIKALIQILQESPPLTKDISPVNGSISASDATSNSIANKTEDNNSTVNKPNGNEVESAPILARTASRAIMVSAIPCDKPEHILSLMQMLGIVLNDKFYQYENGTQEYRLIGFQEAINWCLTRDESGTRGILGHHPAINKKTIPIIAMELYKDIIAARISSTMPPALDQNIDIKNGYYKIGDEDLAMLRSGATALCKAVRYRGDGRGNIHEGIASHPGTNWGEVTKALRLLGTAKLRKIYTLVKLDLDSNPQRKVIIGGWYVLHLNWFLQALSDYGAVLLYGETKMMERERVINLFQQFDSACRVIIINPTVGGMSISLDDQNGNWPRSMFLVPDYRLIDLIQCTGRVNRESTRSNSETIIRFVYAKEFQGESKILTSLLRKSRAARSVISTQSGLILPDSYANEIEESSGPVDFPIPPLPQNLDLNNADSEENGDSLLMFYEMERLTEADDEDSILYI